MLTIKTSERRHRCCLCKLWTGFVHCSGVSNIDFERANVSSVHWKLTIKPPRWSQLTSLLWLKCKRRGQVRP